MKRWGRGGDPSDRAAAASGAASRRRRAAPQRDKILAGVREIQKLMGYAATEDQEQLMVMVMEHALAGVRASRAPMPPPKERPYPAEIEAEVVQVERLRAKGTGAKYVKVWLDVAGQTEAYCCWIHPLHDTLVAAQKRMATLRLEKGSGGYVEITAVLGTRNNPATERMAQLVAAEKVAA